MAGPYRFVAHPLYVANLLVIAGLLLQLLGLSLFVLVWLAFPVGLYARLGHAESMLLKRQAPPLREAPFQWTTGRWRSEWASVLPPFILWLGFALWP
jgi:protein-S-isoprenylcysteine O-methyltransferase Ste14